MTFLDRSPHDGTVGQRPFRQAVLDAAKLLGALAGLALLTHISWNLFAPELFGLPQIRMKHALGLVTFASVFGALIGHSFGQSFGRSFGWRRRG